ncbi:GtrA family protein [Vibrio sp. F74]|uniref:GtrA family protein n=1 Tax=Vibrio sp. F74 TaxID=700020 RepID=UPI0035F5B2CF
MRIVKFGSVGILNTSFSYLVFCGLLYVNVYYLAASALSFIAGTALSYMMNSKYTFSADVSTKRFLKFFIIMVASLTFSLLLLYILKSVAGIDVLIAQILVVLIRFPIMYLLMKCIVFNQVRS